MVFKVKLAFLCLLKVVASVEESDVCSSFSLGQPCVTTDNIVACKRLEESGCKEILVMESCPLQFACAQEGV